MRMIRFVLISFFSFFLNQIVLAQDAISPVYFHPSYGFPGGYLQVFGTDFDPLLTVRIGDSEPCEIISVSEDKKSMKIKLPSVISTDKIKIYSGENSKFESLGALAIITPPLFLSTPLLEVHYNDPYTYSIINDFVGNSDSNLYPDVIPNWLSHFKDTVVVNGVDSIEYKNFKPVQFGAFENGVALGGVAEDPYGNVFVMSSLGNEIFKVDYATGNTSSFISGLRFPASSRNYSLYISDNYLFIPRQNASFFSVTRISLSDQSKAIQSFLNISGGAYSVFQFGGKYFLPSYQFGRINSKVEGGTSQLSKSGLALNGPTGIGFATNSSAFFLGTGQNRTIVSFDSIDSLNDGTVIFSSDASNKWVEGFNRTQKGDFFIALKDGGLIRYYPEIDSLSQISITATENVRSISNSGRGSVIYTNFETDKLFKLQNWSLLAGTPQKSDVGIHKVILRSNNDAGDGFQEFYIKVVDRVPPELIAVSPEHERSHVPVNAKLRLTFNEEIQLGKGGKLAVYSGVSSVPIQEFDLTNPLDLVYLSISEDQFSLDVVLKDDLPYDSKITIAVINDSNGNVIEDLSDNAFSGFSFESDFWYFFTKRLLKIKAGSQSKVFDGSSLINSTYSIISGSLYEGDTLVSVTVTGTQTTVGSSSNVAQSAVILDSAGVDVISNYQIFYKEGILKIEKRTLQITAFNASKTYGDAFVFLGNEFKVEGLAAGDQVNSVTLSSPGASPFAEVGSYPILIKDALGQGLENYQIYYTNGLLEINKKLLKIQVKNSFKEFGAQDPTFEVNIEGLVDGEEIERLQGKGAFTRDIGEGVGIYEVRFSGLESNNYRIEFLPGFLSIGKKNLEIQVVSLEKIYGEKDPVFSVIYSDSLAQVDLNGSLKIERFPGENVGSYDLRPSGYFSENFEIIYINGSLDILPRTVVIQSSSVLKTYGDSDPVFDYSVEGLMEGDVFSGSLTRIPGEDVGQYKIIQGDLQITNPNYKMIFFPGDLTIIPRKIFITPDPNLFKFYEELDPELVFSVANLADFDVKENVLSGKPERQNGEQVGEYDINLGSLKSSLNYIIEFESKVFQIKPKTVEIKIRVGNQKIYGEPDPKLEFSDSNVELLLEEYKISISRQIGEVVGRYEFKLVFEQLVSNYVFLMEDSWFTILPRVLTIRPTPGQRKQIGTADPENLNFKASNFGFQDDEEILTGRLSRQEGEGAGYYPIGLGDLKANQNYVISIVPEDFEIFSDSRTLGVNNIVVSESSQHAVFTVSGAGDQLVSLVLKDGTAVAADYGPELEYFNGSSWESYLVGSYVALDSFGTLKVRTRIQQDDIFEGRETFSLIATNTGGNSAEGVATIFDYITLAKNDYAIVRGTPGGTNFVSGNVLDNDFNTEGPEIELKSTLLTSSDELKGILDFNDDGSYTFTPSLGFSGIVEVDYKVCGGSPFETCDTATLFIKVERWLVAQPDINVTFLGIPITGSVATNDIVPLGSVYGDPISDQENLAGGELTMRPDGSYSFDANLPGVYTYSIPVCSVDESCSTGILTITVKDRDNPVSPILNTDWGVVRAGDFILINSLSNDSPGRLGVLLNPASVTIINQPKSGTVTPDPATGDIRYTPTPGFLGKDVYIYSACDSGDPALCALAFQEITVISRDALNLIYAADDFVRGPNGSSLIGNVLLNDSDLLGSKLIIVSQEKETGQGIFQLNEDGSFAFLPKPGFIGPVQLTYQVCTSGEDPICANATLYLLVEPNELLAEMDNFQNNEINGLEGGNPGNVLRNDLINGKPVKATDVAIKVEDNGGIAGLVIDSNGDLLIPKDTAPGTYVLSYSICDVFDPSNCSSAIIIVEVFHGVNLRIFKDALTVNNFEGDQIEYIIRVENNGTTDAINVVAIDTLPIGLSYISSTVIGATASTLISGQENSWTFVSLSAGSSAEIRIRVKAEALTDGKERSILNTATVSSQARELSPNDNSSSANVLIKPFIVPNVITPNDDRKNDEFVINGLGKYASNELIIIDRWGSHVYQKKGYLNDWSGEGLVAGTYFYILSVVDFNGVETEFKGWIQLIRE